MEPITIDVVRTVRAVFSRPTRLRRLIALGPSGWRATAVFLLRVVPAASEALRGLRRRAAAIPDDALRAQALASIDGKAYHVQGGSILATFLPRAAARRYIEIVAPLETIYDYLDNLCDRLPGVDETAFATLHEALRDAVDPERPLADYYRDGPRGDDGGYLRGLVADVRAGLQTLPHFPAVRARLAEAAHFYAELQTYKHLAPNRREAVCDAWYARHRERFPGLYWWEFAAACGSSLPIFAMLFLASGKELAAADVDATFRAYFPNVSAVHILLDYFIDQAEDREHRELNFVACYASSGEAVERVARLIRSTAERLATLTDARWHEFLLNAMCTFYLTHPKVFEQNLDHESAAVLGALRPS